MLSRRQATQHISAATHIKVTESKEALRAAQLADNDNQRSSQCPKKQPTSKEWGRPPLSHYRQLWSLLTMEGRVVCRKYSPGPTWDSITVPVLSRSLWQTILAGNHDTPSAGHKGIECTLERVRNEAYWVNMVRDVERHCQECTNCQEVKLPAPVRALTSMPVGRIWQMSVVDILEVPVSHKNNRYLIVIQNGQMSSPWEIRQQHRS